MSKSNEVKLRHVMNTSTARTSFTSREIADPVEEDHARVKNVIGDFGLRGLLNGPKTIQPAGTEDADNVYNIVEHDGFVVCGEFSPEFLLMILQRMQELERDRCEPPAADWREDPQREVADSKHAARGRGQIKRLQ